ncbi:N-acetylmuramoyl-L-alanine amidase domain-containing protein [Frankia sp. AiPs1]|uniref:peptidoglycan recognition protein family protein n=1 Tax=Frankia sp. AiPa1 TaxID=573492 RepID=UPI00202B74A3|nr:N-acetylmuramoyl-L-alanine amidase [Frankia sp. AiPa1]MCL9759132.1 N-acetylmuramoyl-L-alanine amidase [Frankia sp. AiPa1]
MAATLYPPARYRPVRNTSGSMVQPTRGLIPHVQVGNGSLFSWFDNSSSQVSSHLWLSRNGVFEQYVRFDQRAWAEAAGNPYWISCECEGYPTDDYTPIQVTRLAELFRWGMQEFGWKAEVTDSPNGYGIGTHRMGGTAWGGHDCPGDIRANRRGDILSLATGQRTFTADPRERYAGRPTLREGTTGSDVTELQNALNIIFGHEAPTGDPNRITPDGVYGSRTTARVASLQRYASPWFGRITDDGACGSDTWRKIGWILTGLNRSV